MKPIMLLPGLLNNMNDVVAFLRQQLSNNPVRMSLKQQEKVAAGVVGLAVNDKFGQWQKDYPKLNKIFEMAVDLEWSNVPNADEVSDYWRSIEKLTEELEQEVSIAGSKFAK